MSISIEKQLVDLYLSNVDILDEGLPVGINSQRSGALESFNLIGLPQRGSGLGDRYHYTDIQKSFDVDYEYYFMPSYTHVKPAELVDRALKVSLVNNFCVDSRSLTQLENGVIYGSLAAAVSEFPSFVEKYYNKLSDNLSNPVTALTTAFFQDGAFIFVPQGVKVDIPFLISNSFYADHESVAGFGRNLFIIESGAEANIILDFQTLAEEHFWECATREVYVGEGAKCELVEVCRMNMLSKIISTSYVNQESSSNFKSMTLALGGELIRADQSIKLNGPFAENATNALIISGAAQHIDVCTDIEHNAPDCTSREHVKGIAADGGIGVFAGRIFVARDAQRTSAFQHNNNLLINDNAHIYTKPQLEIYADNVKCSHGATVGQLDLEAIYYMRQRGLSTTDARRLQMYGFVAEVTSRCAIEGFSDILEHLAIEKIESL